MAVRVNGELRALPDGGLSLATLLRESGVDDSTAVSVQHNGAFVDPSRYAGLALADGDEVEFLYFLGGGAAE